MSNLTKIVITIKGGEDFDGVSVEIGGSFQDKDIKAILCCIKDAYEYVSESVSFPVASGSRDRPN